MQSSFALLLDKFYAQDMQYESMVWKRYRTEHDRQFLNSMFKRWGAKYECENGFGR